MYSDIHIDDTWVLQTSYTEKKGEAGQSKYITSIDDGSSKVNNPRKTLEEEYLDMEAKFLTTLSVVETMKRQFYVQTEGIFRRDDQKVKDLFDALKK
ncbi:hypothetical protein GBA52_019503 [Prunus armeniaca]|nr:hypothetical protein GBA52_019503 [Prunus armeniaca]